MNRWIVFVLSLLLSACATHGVTSGQVVIKDDTGSVRIRITDQDRALIEQYYRKSKKLPPGLTKRESLPPGLAKRDTLPPGLRGEALPSELEARLSPLPTSYVRVRIGRDIVLMDGKTRIVFDVIYDIVK